VVALGVALSPALGAAQGAGSPHLDRARAAYDRFQYEEALKEVDRALAQGGTTRADEVHLALLEGMAAAELARKDRALRAFARALALDPRVVLPDGVSPKVEALFAAARRVQAAAASQPGSAPAPDPPRGPPGPDPAPSGPAQPRARPSPWSWLLGSAVAADVLAKSVGADVRAGVGYRGWEAAAVVLLGADVGVALEAARLFGPPAIRVKVGLRGTTFPTASAWGGGGVVGLRVRIAAGLCATADVAVEGFHVPPPYRQLAVVVGAGLAFDSGARAR
jgi:hypothetical protein